MTPEEQAARETWRGVMEIHYRHERSEEKSNTAKWNLSAGEGWQIIAAAIEQARRDALKEAGEWKSPCGHLTFYGQGDGSCYICVVIEQARREERKRVNGVLELVHTQHFQCPVGDGCIICDVFYRLNVTSEDIARAQESEG